MKARSFKALVAAATLAATTVTAAAQVVYNRGNDSDPESLDLHKTSTVSEAHILRDLYEGLVVYDATAEIVPGVATEWQVSEDGLVYTFRLRPEAMWSNGDPVTANDFVFAYRRIQDPATAAPYANVLYPILNAEAINKGEVPADQLGVRAIDDHTLEITLENPTPYFLQLLTHQTALPLHQASVEALGDEFVRPGNMVSNGAYTLSEFTLNDKIVLDRNPHHYDTANVQIDRVVYFPFEDRSACLRRFEAGEIHSCSDVPTEQMEYILANLADRFRLAPYLGTYYFAVKTDKQPFGDVRVRQALSLLIDREFLAEDIWASTMVPAYSFVPPGISNYTAEPAYMEGRDLPLLDREEMAAALLAEAGFGPNNPLTVDIRYNTSENHQRTATAIADMWRPFGINTTLTNVDGSTHFSYLQNKGDYDLARAGWIADYSDPQNFLFMLQTDNPTFNYASWSNAEFDALMAEAEAETDLAARAEILHRAETIMMAELPFIPLMYYGSHSLVSERLVGWEDNVQNVHATRWLQIQ